MTPRTWLIVTAATGEPLKEHDWFAELQPVPDELALRDRVAVISWPDRGIDQRPVLAGTATVVKLSRETRVLRLRHRVAAVLGHEIPVASFGTRLAAARGWWAVRREDLLDEPRLVSERDFAQIEGALLDVAHEFGPVAKRPAHSRPRTPGRRALIAGRTRGR